MGIRSRLIARFIDRIMSNTRTRRVVLRHLFDEGNYFMRDVGDHMIAFYPHDYLGLVLAEDGEFSRDVVTALNAMLETRGQSLAAKTILEVGANIGTHTVYFLKDLDCAHVIAVEPDPLNFKLLKANVALNGFSDRVTPLRYAASDTSGTAEFTRNLINLGASGLGPAGERAWKDSKQVFKVPVEQIDVLLEKTGRRAEDIGLIWMDVEGHEAQALAGMKKLIAQSQAPVFFEFRQSADRDRNQMIEDLIFGSFADVFLYDDGFHPLDRDGFRSLPHLADIFAVH